MPDLVKLLFQAFRMYIVTISVAFGSYLLNRIMSLIFFALFGVMDIAIQGLLLFIYNKAQIKLVGCFYDEKY